MKKIIVFLITILLLIPLNTHARTTQFYEGQYIDNVWMNKVTSDGKTIYYQKARMFREKKYNKIAYCIEPFEMFNENSNYQDTVLPENLTEEQKERIKLLSYLGYSHKNKGQDIWYAVTQLLIWQTADPTGEYYFTDSLNGNKINTYQSLIDQLNKDVEDYKNNSSFQKEYTIILGEKIEIIDENSFFTKYSTSNQYTTIQGNKITIENLPVGTHTITITKEEVHYSSPTIFYQSQTSQNIVTLGNLESQEITITVKVKDTSVKVTKLDYDTDSTNSTGEAKLEGAKYQIYDQNMNEINQIEINTTSSATIKNLPIGKYYIKELEAGIGYELDTNLYEFELTNRKPEIHLYLKNKVIKGILEINKVYIKNDKEYNEPNISFNIYNRNNELVQTITTDTNGYATIELPYGLYKIEQLNTTEGYQYIEPFQIIIKDANKLTYNLKNYEIEVPNTYAENSDSLVVIIIKKILKILGITC